MAGALYASAIVLYDPRLESVVGALPWILSGACCAVLDASVSFSYTTYWHITALELLHFFCILCLLV